MKRVKITDKDVGHNTKQMIASFRKNPDDPFALIRLARIIRKEHEGITDKNLSRLLHVEYFKMRIMLNLSKLDEDDLALLEQAQKFLDFNMPQSFLKSITDDSRAKTNMIRDFIAQHDGGPEFLKSHEEGTTAEETYAEAPAAETRAGHEESSESLKECLEEGTPKPELEKAAEEKKLESLNLLYQAKVSQVTAAIKTLSSLAHLSPGLTKAILAEVSAEDLESAKNMLT